MSQLKSNCFFLYQWCGGPRFNHNYVSFYKLDRNRLRSFSIDGGQLKKNMFTLKKIIPECKAITYLSKIIKAQFSKFSNK